MEEAAEILNYFPIHRTQQEDDYINHLYTTFVLLEQSNRLWKRADTGFAELDDSQGVARSFAMMPYHLLFMLAIQYKLLRIATEKRDSFLLAFTIPLRDCKEVLKDTVSVYDFALLNESHMLDLLKIVTVTPEIIGKAKILIKFRNDKVAHAKGHVPNEENLQTKVTEYLVCLQTIQKNFEMLNNKVAEEWDAQNIAGYTSQELLESRLLDSKLCAADFGSGKLKEKYGRYVLV